MLPPWYGDFVWARCRPKKKRISLSPLSTEMSAICYQQAYVSVLHHWLKSLLYSKVRPIRGVPYYIVC